MTSTDGDWKRPDGCECGVEEPDEFCPHHGRSHKELCAEVERLRVEMNTRYWEGIRAENDRLRVAVGSRAVVSQERLRLEGLSLAGVMLIIAERDRLRAVLEATGSNVVSLMEASGLMSLEQPKLLRILAALRARAGEPTPPTVPLQRCRSRSSQGLTCGLAPGHDGDHNALAWAGKMPGYEDAP